MREQFASVRILKEAARALSEACIDHLSPPSNVVPLVQLYNHSVLDQPVSVEMAWLLGKIR